ncbi:MAG: hypothetical protein ACYCX4_04015 [Bacillota bacterium]
MEKIILSKKVIAETIALYYNSVEFPEGIYISMENSYALGRCSVLNILDSEPSIFDEVARIDELVVNIPNNTDIRRYLQERHNVTGLEGVTPCMLKEFWENYRWEFASTVNKKSIEWE